MKLTPENARLDRWMARQAELEAEIYRLRAELAEATVYAQQAGQFEQALSQAEAELKQMKWDHMACTPPIHTASRAGSLWVPGEGRK